MEARLKVLLQRISPACSQTLQRLATASDVRCMGASPELSQCSVTFKPMLPPTRGRQWAVDGEPLTVTGLTSHVLLTLLYALNLRRMALPETLREHLQRCVLDRLETIA